jgi:general secretion pathway protein B
MSTTAPRVVEPIVAPASASAPIVSRAETPAPPELKPHPLAKASETSGARDLAAEAQVEARQSARARRSAAVASVTPPTETVANATAPTPVSAPAAAMVKFLRTMPPDFQRSLPQLTVNIHIYAPREDDRILYINNHQYHSGDRVGDGIVVEEIVEDGAVLSFHGQRFKLPRPS